MKSPRTTINTSNKLFITNNSRLLIPKKTEILTQFDDYISKETLTPRNTKSQFHPYPVIINKNNNKTPIHNGLLKLSSPYKFRQQIKKLYSSKWKYEKMNSLTLANSTNYSNLNFITQSPTYHRKENSVSNNNSIVLKTSHAKIKSSLFLKDNSRNINKSTLKKSNTNLYSASPTNKQSEIKMVKAFNFNQYITNEINDQCDRYDQYDQLDQIEPIKKSNEINDDQDLKEKNLIELYKITYNDTSNNTIKCISYVNNKKKKIKKRNKTVDLKSAKNKIILKKNPGVKLKLYVFKSPNRTIKDLAEDISNDVINTPKVINLRSDYLISKQKEVEENDKKITEQLENRAKKKMVHLNEFCDKINEDAFIYRKMKANYRKRILYSLYAVHRNNEEINDKTNNNFFINYINYIFDGYNVPYIKNNLSSYFRKEKNKGSSNKLNTHIDLSKNFINPNLNFYFYSIREMLLNENKAFINKQIMRLNVNRENIKTYTDDKYYLFNEEFEFDNFNYLRPNAVDNKEVSYTLRYYFVNKYESYFDTHIENNKRICEIIRSDRMDINKIK